ncbi:MAG: hypothetical protein RG740_07525 [Acholeplasmataceae bacterium]|nr:hypothetical protein [Acholeplasmataceae bacterium]
MIKEEHRTDLRSHQFSILQPAGLRGKELATVWHAIEKNREMIISQVEKEDQEPVILELKEFTIKANKNIIEVTRR